MFTLVTDISGWPAQKLLSFDTRIIMADNFGSGSTPTPFFPQVAGAAVITY